jgi:hypothetical protein
VDSASARGRFGSNVRYAHRGEASLRYGLTGSFEDLVSPLFLHIGPGAHVGTIVQEKSVCIIDESVYYLKRPAGRIDKGSGCGETPS